MGSCLSKKSACASSPVSLPKPPEKNKSESQLEKKTTEEENIVKKEIFIIKHRKSHEIERQQRSSDEEIKGASDVEKGKNVIPSNGLDGHGGGGAPVRTSSCTKEEVDAILIQCGRLSRSSSTGKAAENGSRKYSGSKRSYDFDGESGNGALDGDGDAVARERENRRRERHRQSQGRRRTPSRERERDQQQRSGSRERGGGGGGRRVSRSPGRRSESPIPTNSSAGNSRPGKMVSVPATVSSVGGEAVKRIQVKRNVGGASPRARSPARMRGSNENQQQPMSLSRSNSRKAEHSPYRRNPLAEIDTNIISQKPNADNKIVQVVSENRNNSSNNLTTTNVKCKNHPEQQQPIAQETYGIPNVALNVICSSGPENPKTQQVTRSRSSRLSRDLDINPETLSSNPNTSSYTALLLEDIQNFHQKSTPLPAFTLPPCVTKACSILEAVADLNSSTGSNLSSTPFPEQTNKIKKTTKPEMKDPILESEVVANDDLTEPSFHKYVTVRRGTSGGEDDMEEQESSGSNSFAGSQQHWGVSSSCWEPNSAESTDRWMLSSSSRSVTRQVMSESGRVVVVDESGKKVSANKKRDSDHQQNGIGRGQSNNMACNAAGST